MRFLYGVLATVALAGPCDAQGPSRMLSYQSALRDCQSSGLGWKQTIERCTVAIDSGMLQPREMVDALIARAKNYTAEKQYDNASGDLDRAIERKSDVQPSTQADAYSARALVHVARGRKDLAIVDLQAAYALFPNDWYAARLRELGVEPKAAAAKPPPPQASTPPAKGGGGCGGLGGAIFGC
jgi:tetratricopeptide (TPR) repeat protein